MKEKKDGQRKRLGSEQGHLRGLTRVGFECGIEGVATGKSGSQGL